ncbi:MAG: hypothetical protein DI637_07735 [Citromicrobium sp.]|nr:MAG: hypothetical protein DI637_07735 [Citromicrobium sp.]
MTGLVALGLAPGTFVRSAVEPEPEIAAARPQIARVDVPATDAGGIRVEGVWEVSSADRRIGGFSALTATGPEELVAISDAAQIVRIALREGEPSRIGIADPARPVRPPSGVALETKGVWDVESLARDPASGSLWLGFESSNAIERYTPDFRMAASVQPAAMRDWSANSGPEAMARLDDGRFLVLEEGTADMFGSDHRGLLFADDPTEGHRPVQFRLASPDGYRPVDAGAAAFRVGAHAGRCRCHRTGCARRGDDAGRIARGGAGRELRRAGDRRADDRCGDAVADLRRQFRRFPADADREVAVRHKPRAARVVPARPSACIDQDGAGAPGITPLRRQLS